ncbi:MAG: hypothetical protein ACLFT0_13670, partial [Spirulinaceae cyanobacterium]
MMSNSSSFDEIIAHNQAAIEELAWSLESFVGEFKLFVAHCNYTHWHDTVIANLRETTHLNIQVLRLQPHEQTLLKRIQEEIQGQSPDVLMILGLEAVIDREGLLSNANQVRETFQQNCPFPVVLWVNDAVLTTLLRTAPDMESWATTTRFEIAPVTLKRELQQQLDNLFELLLSWGDRIFTQPLPLEEVLTLSLEELQAAQQDLQHHLDSTLEADLQFALALMAYRRQNRETALTYYRHSLTLWQQFPNPGRQAVVLFYLGVCGLYQAKINSAVAQESLEQAKQDFDQCLQVCETARQPDWVARFINPLGEVLQTLEAWDGLAKLAQRSLKLQQQHNDSVRWAKALGYLANVALHNKEYQKAKTQAQQGLEVLGTVTNTLQQPHLYLLLAKAEIQLGETEAAISNLEKAKQLGSYNTLQPYLEIVQTLRAVYFQQKQYLKAFETKLEQQWLEQQYRLRAFVGAGRIRPGRIARANLASIVTPDAVAQEIAAFGWTQKIKSLRERIGRNDSKLTVLHGPSGVGKSSLIEAGLAPSLLQKPIGTRTVLAVVMRVYGDWVAELGRLLTQIVDQPIDVPASALPLTTKAEILSQLRQNEKNNRLTVLIFDQFEEFFFVNSNPAQWREFFEFIGECLEILPVKVILSLREDYIHFLLECNRLENWKAVGNDILSRNVLYRIGDLSQAEAQQIIEELTQQANFPLESELIAQLVADLANDVGEVRPIELQVMGAQLQAEQITTLAKYREKGNKTELVERYLKAVIADCGPENEELAELILYSLTDEQGTRPLKTHGQLQQELKTLSTTLAMQDIPNPQNLDLVLKIFVGSGLTMLLPEKPEDRYQLVHDYLAAFIRQQQEPLSAQLAKEREQRLLTEAELQRTREQSLRRLKVTGLITVLTGVAAAVIVAAVGGWATQTVSRTDKEKEEATAQVESLQNKEKQILSELDLTQNQLQDTETTLQKTKTDIQDAEARAEEAQENYETARNQQREAEQQVKQANQNLITARQRAAQAQANIAEANRQVEQAEKRVVEANQQYEEANQAAETARREKAEAEQEQQEAIDLKEEAEIALEAAEAAQKVAKQGTQLEQLGVSALRQFEHQQIEALMTALEVGHELQKLVKPGQPLAEYPAISPLLALNTILDNIWERNQLKGHQGWVRSAAFSPDGEMIVTASEDGTAK